MSYEKLTDEQRVQAVNIDCMRHPQFALVSSIICMGKSEVTDEMPTAATDGLNKMYGRVFLKANSRKQQRYVCLHENFHVAFKHCTLYKELREQYPTTYAQAIDYAANGLIEEIDPKFEFVERPTLFAPLVDSPRFGNMSMPQILKELLKEKSEEERQKEQGEGGEGGNSPFDVHLEPDDEGEEGEGAGDTEKRRMKLMKEIDDALRQGELLVRKMAGNGKGGRDVFGLAAERKTDWKSAMQDWLSSVCQGDENSRFCPPNRRLLASGFLMPSHFSETVGEIIIACDTSGSMHGYYPTVFGEVARIMQNVRPDKVRMLWWDTAVCGDQEFTPDQYDQIADQLKPAGGGGTTPTCVLDYIKRHKIEAKAIVWLTDGYLYCPAPPTPMPSLWGVVENEEWMPDFGKVLRISV